LYRTVRDYIRELGDVWERLGGECAKRHRSESLADDHEAGGGGPGTGFLGGAFDDENRQLWVTLRMFLVVGPRLWFLRAFTQEERTFDVAVAKI